jgi:hypothetical protein
MQLMSVCLGVVELIWPQLNFGGDHACDSAQTIKIAEPALPPRGKRCGRRIATLVRQDALEPYHGFQVTLTNSLQPQGKIGRVKYYLV